jgi:hypothetical protein
VVSCQTLRGLRRAYLRYEVLLFLEVVSRKSWGLTKASMYSFFFPKWNLGGVWSLDRFPLVLWKGEKFLVSMFFPEVECGKRVESSIETVTWLSCQKVRCVLWKPCGLEMMSACLPPL